MKLACHWVWHIQVNKNTHILKQVSRWYIAPKDIIGHHYFQDSPDQCPMPIKIMALIRNTSQCRSLPINADQFRSIPLNVDQCRLMPDQAELIRHWSALTVFTNVLMMPWSGIDRHWEKLIRIDRQWSALRGISDQCHDFDRHCSALGIDRGSPVIGTDVTESMETAPDPLLM